VVARLSKWTNFATVVDATVYRVFTAPLFHGSFRDLLLNLITFTLAASYIERNLGTVIFTYVLVGIHLASSLLLMVFSYMVATSWIVPVGSFLHSAQEHIHCTYGISALVCALAVFNLLHRHNRASAHEVPRELHTDSWAGGTAQLLRTPANVLTGVLLVSIFISLPGLGLKYLSGAIIGALAAVFYERLLLPMPYVHYFEAEAAVRLAGRMGSFKLHTETLLPSPPPTPLEEMVASQHASSLAKLRDTPISSFGVELPPLNIS